MSNIVALNTFLIPFQKFFVEGVSEISINKPLEVWVERHGDYVRHDAPEFTLDYLWQFARLVAEYNQREISAEMPSLSSTLPNGARVQFVVEPACEKGSFICSIRQPSVVKLLLDDYFKGDDGKAIKQTSKKENSQYPIELAESYTAKDYSDFLKQAVIAKKNIIISGGTSTGKTTFLNALLANIPLNERIITIETDREVKSSHPNAVHLLAAEEGKSAAKITMLGLLKASLRLRPDRILVSELRAEEAFPYLRAVNSGHPGSITTLHADSVEGCFNQLAFMVIQGGSSLTKHELIEYAKSIIDVVVQIKRTDSGRRYISEIYFKGATEGLNEKSSIREIRQVAN